MASSQIKKHEPMQGYEEAIDECSSSASASDRVHVVVFILIFELLHSICIWAVANTGYFTEQNTAWKTQNS